MSAFWHSEPLFFSVLRRDPPNFSDPNLPSNFSPKPPKSKPTLGGKRWARKWSNVTSNPLGSFIPLGLVARCERHSLSRERTRRENGTAPRRLRASSPPPAPALQRHLTKLRKTTKTQSWCGFVHLKKEATGDRWFSLATLPMGVGKKKRGHDTKDGTLRVVGSPPTRSPTPNPTLRISASLGRSANTEHPGSGGRLKRNMLGPQRKAFQFKIHCDEEVTATRKAC